MLEAAVLDRVESALAVALDGVLDIVEGRLVEQVVGVGSPNSSKRVCCAAMQCAAQQQMKGKKSQTAEQRCHMIVAMPLYCTHCWEKVHARTTQSVQCPHLRAVEWGIWVVWCGQVRGDAHTHTYTRTPNHFFACFRSNSACGCSVLQF